MSNVAPSSLTTNSRKHFTLAPDFSHFIPPSSSLSPLCTCCLTNLSPPPSSTSLSRATTCSHLNTLNPLSRSTSWRHPPLKPSIPLPPRAPARHPKARHSRVQAVPSIIGDLSHVSRREHPPNPSTPIPSPPLRLASGQFLIPTNVSRMRVSNLSKVLYPLCLGPQLMMERVPYWYEI